MISVAAELVGMHPQTLRIYEQKGLVHPQRTAGNTRLYSDADVERLRLIQRLTTELGLNLAGVERVLHMEDELGVCDGVSSGWSRRCAVRSTRCTALPARPRALPSPAGSHPVRRDEEEDRWISTKLTIKSQEAVAAAQDIARRRGNPEITPDHLLLALLDQELFADWQGLRPEAERRSPRCPRSRAAQQQPNASAALVRVLDQADEERARLGDDYVSTEHLFLALDRRRATRSSAWIKEIRGGQRVTSQDPEAPTRRSPSSAVT